MKLVMLVYILNGIFFASILFLISAGLVLIFGAMNILNLAHGSFFTLGAYLAGTFIILSTRMGFPALMFAVMILATVIVGIVGLGLEVSLFKPIYERAHVYQLLLTFGLVLIFEDIFRLIWGTTSYSAPEPYTYLGYLTMFGFEYPVYAFLVMGVGILSLFFLIFLLRKTRIGKIIRVVTENRYMAAALGVDTKRVFSQVFFIGSILAGLGGSITIPMLVALPGLAVEMVVLAFAVIIVSGIKSIEGVYVVSLIMGLLRSFGVVYFPEFVLFIIYLVVIIVFMFRPRGLFE